MQDPVSLLRRVSDPEHPRAELAAQLGEKRARKQQPASAGANEPDQVRTLLRRLMREIAEHGAKPDPRTKPGARSASRWSAWYSTRISTPFACAMQSQRGLIWRPLGDSNPCNHRERVVS